jgi:hypothetical protein
MPVDKIVDVTNISPFRGVANGCNSCFIAILAPIIGVLALWFTPGFLMASEREAVLTSRALESGSRNVVSLGAPAYNPANNGRLVYFTGRLAGAGPVTDPVFHVSRRDLRLDRAVEMYAWTESIETEDVGDKQVTTCTYSTEWTGSPPDSSLFRHPAHHYNPPMPVDSTTMDASARCGAFSVATALADGIDATAPVPSAAVPMRAGWQRDSNGLYHGGSPTVRGSAISAWPSARCRARP